MNLKPLPYFQSTNATALRKRNLQIILQQYIMIQLPSTSLDLNEKEKERKGSVGTLCSLNCTMEP